MHTCVHARVVAKVTCVCDSVRSESIVFLCAVVYVTYVRDIVPECDFNSRWHLKRAGTRLAICYKSALGT